MSHQTPSPPPPVFEVTVGSCLVLCTCSREHPEAGHPSGVFHPPNMLNQRKNIRKQVSKKTNGTRPNERLEKKSSSINCHGVSCKVGATVSVLSRWWATKKISPRLLLHLLMLVLTASSFFANSALSSMATFASHSSPRVLLLVNARAVTPSPTVCSAFFLSPVGRSPPSPTSSSSAADLPSQGVPPHRSSLLGWPQSSAGVTSVQNARVQPRERCSMCSSPLWCW